MVRSPIGNAQIGSSFTLNSITAAVLGGAALAGGRATFIGSTVAAVLLALIITALPFLGLSPTDGSMIIGLLVLAGDRPVPVRRISTELFKRNVRKARRLMRGSNIVEHADIPNVYPAGQRLLGGAHRAHVDQERIRAQHRSPDRRGRRLRRADRRRSDRRRRKRPRRRRRHGHRRVRHDRHAGLRRQPPPHLGGRAAQHRHRRAARGPVELPHARAAQVGAGVPARGRLHGQPAVGAGRHRRRNHQPVGLVAHPGLTGPHRCRRPGVEGLRHAGRVRVRVPVVGEVGRATAELVRADGHRAFRDAGPDVDARPGGARPRVHGLRGDPRSLEAGHERSGSGSRPTSASVPTASTPSSNSSGGAAYSVPTPPTSTARRSATPRSR